MPGGKVADRGCMVAVGRSDSLRDCKSWSSWCVGEEDRKVASSWCSGRRQRARVSNRQVITNKGIPHFCYIVVFNEAYEYIYTLCTWFNTLLLLYIICHSFSNIGWL